MRGSVQQHLEDISLSKARGSVYCMCWRGVFLVFHLCWNMIPVSSGHCVFSVPHYISRWQFWPWAELKLCWTKSWSSILIFNSCQWPLSQPFWATSEIRQQWVQVHHQIILKYQQQPFQRPCQHWHGSLVAHASPTNSFSHLCWFSPLNLWLSLLLMPECCITTYPINIVIAR